MSLPSDPRNSAPQDPSFWQGLGVIFHTLCGTLLSREMRTAWEEDIRGDSALLGSHRITGLCSALALVFALVGAKGALENPSPASSTSAAAGVISFLAWERNRRVLRQPARIAHALHGMRAAEFKAEVVFNASSLLQKTPYRGLESPLVRKLAESAARAQLNRATLRFQQAAARYGVPSMIDTVFRVPQPEGNNPQDRLPVAVGLALDGLKKRPARPPFYSARVL